jgi:hypothetical protein
MRVFGGDDQVVLETGSFTGFHRLGKLGSGYLEATEEFKQPLCGNEEGWGPISRHRYDFTPCFLDVWMATVAAFGIVFGAVALAWILKRREPSPVDKDWHFWMKQVRIDP